MVDFISRYLGMFAYSIIYIWSSPLEGDYMNSKRFIRSSNTGCSKKKDQKYWAFTQLIHFLKLDQIPNTNSTRVGPNSEYGPNTKLFGF